MTRDDADAIAEAAVKRTFLTLGIDISDPEAVIKVQSDFQHLRMWRESTEAVKRKALLTAVGVLVAGAIGYLLLAMRGH